MTLYYYYMSTEKYISLLIGRGHFSWEIWEISPKIGEWRKLPHKIELEVQTHGLQQFDDALEPIR